MLDVSILIVNYNTADIIPACLASIFQQQQVRYEIIVVDNASSDNSIARLNTYADKIHLLANTNNIGFGRANNQAFKDAKGRFVFLLNPDAQLQSPFDLQKLLAYMEKNPDIGMLGPCIMKKNKAYLPQKNYPGEKYSHSQFQQLPGSIAWIVGACLLLRHETYARVNGFDEDFFLYGEEADLALRIRQQGLAIAYYPEVIVKHIGGASERKTSPKEIWLKKQNGKHLFYQKHYAPAHIQLVLTNEIKFAKKKLFLLKLKKWLRWYSHHDNEKFIRYQTVVETSTALLKALTLARNTT